MQQSGMILSCNIATTLSKIRRSILPVCMLLTVCSGMAHAERAQTSSTVHLAQLLKGAAINAPLQHKPRSITTYVNGLGRIAFKFESAKKSRVVPEVKINGNTYLDHSPVVVMKGHGTLAGQKLRAAAAISYEAGRPTMYLSFTHRSPITGKQTFYRLQISNLDTRPDVQIERTRPQHVAAGFCGNDHPLAAGLSSESVQAGHQHPDLFVANLAAREIDLSIHADSSYIAAHGSSTAYLQARLNESETIYQDDLGLTFNIVRLIVDNSLSFSSTEGVDLLIDFADYLDARGYSNSADVFHVFTARDITSDGNPNTIGVAFFGFQDDPDPGVVCRPNRFYSQFGFRPAAVGASERSLSSTAGAVTVTFTHEVGHNFAAEHSTSGIMAATLDSNNLPTAFSSASQGEINTYIAKHGSCLSAAEEPDSDPDEDEDDSNDSEDGGGGRGGGADDNTPEAIPVAFSHSLSDDGIFSAILDLETMPGSHCSFVIRMSPNKRKIGFGDIVATAPAHGLSQSFTIQTTHKAKRKNARGKVKKIWAMGTLECPGGASGASAVEQVKAHRVKSRSRKGARGWIKNLARSFLDQAL